MTVNYDDRDVTFEIVEEIGVISTHETGWTREINLVRWNGGAAKYDIREWNPSHDRMSKGITLREDEMRRVLDLMKRRRMNARGSKKIEPMYPSADCGNGMVDSSDGDMS